MGRIAIIDDSRDTLEVLTFLFKDRHDLSTFANPEEFLRSLQDHHYDLILLDLVMPTMDGFTVFQRVREQEPEVPIAAISAQAHEQERQKALGYGFCDYFVKPVLDVDRFVQHVNGHVGRCATIPPGPERRAG